MIHSSAAQWSIFPVRPVGHRLFRRLPRPYREFLFWLASGDHDRADRALEGSNIAIGLDHLMLVAYHNGVLPACIITLEDRYRAMLSPSALACFEDLQRRQRRVTEVEEQLCGELLAIGAAHSVIKGAKLSRYYPRPTLRAYRDIDLHIRDPLNLPAVLDSLGRLGARVRRAPCRLTDPTSAGFAFKCSVPAVALADIVVEIHVGSMHLGSAGPRLSGLFELSSPDSVVFDLLVQCCEWMSRYGAHQLRDHLDFHFLAAALGDEFDIGLQASRQLGLHVALMTVAGGHDRLTGEERSLKALGRTDSLCYLAPAASRWFSRSALQTEGLTSLLGAKPARRRPQWLEGRVDQNEVAVHSEWIEVSGGPSHLVSPLGTLFPPFAGAV